MNYSDVTDLHHRFTQSGEMTGWTGAAMAVLASMSAVAKLFGDITPTDVNGWLLLLGSLVIGGASMWSAVYHRILKARLDGEQYAAIIAANVAAIAAGKPAPYPQFLPAPTSDSQPKTGEYIVQAGKQP